MSKLNGWRCYKHALLPNTAPHERVDTAPLESGELWKQCDTAAFFARWSEDFDCGYETDWWYVIKDAPFDIDSVKAKRRYEIRKGMKYFDVYRIDPAKYAEELYQVQVDAYSVYLEKYRPTVDKEAWLLSVKDTWGISGTTVIGAFDRETNTLCGYARLIQEGKCIYFDSLKTRPAYEKFALNAALVMQVLQEYDAELRQGSYICDGARNVQHETAFPDYLEKYFSFRKAYCHLRLAYKPAYKWVIDVLYALRGVFRKFDNVRLIHQINGVLMMEEIVRKQA